MLNLVAGLLVMVLFTRLLGARGYGILSLLVANVSILTLVTCLGSESGITYHYTSRSLPRQRIFSIVYIVIFFQLMLVLLVEMIHKEMTGHYWLIAGNELRYLAWGLVYLLSVTITDKYLAFLNASHHYTRANQLVFVYNLVLLLSAGYFFFQAVPRNDFFYLQLFIAASLFQAILLVITFHTITRQKLSFSKPVRADWKRFFSYSLLAFITNVIQFLAYRVDYWLIDYYKGEEALGLYSLAVKLGQLFWVLPLLFASMIFPAMADKERDFDINKLRTMIRFTQVVIFFLMGIAALLSSWLIPYVFGKEFSGSVRPFILLLPGIYLFIFNILLAAYFAAENRLRINFAGSMICFILVFILDLWLIPRQGIEGAAIATSVAYGASGIFHIGVFTGFRSKELFALFYLHKDDWLMLKEWFSKIPNR
jgi:O-antigen/teichoic acid export membrane protein